MDSKDTTHITEHLTAAYRRHLYEEEKSPATIEKYMRDIECFHRYAGEQELNKELVIAYKEKLSRDYAAGSINSMLSSLNGLFLWMERYDCRVKRLKVQKQIFCREEKELTKREYERLLSAARKKSERLYLLLETICSTGIRISELQYITAEAVRAGKTQVSCKGKIRVIFIPKGLCRKLKEYTKKQGIDSGEVFITRRGKSLDRSNIWKEMKRLCSEAGVVAAKVFPHNLRHLFARTFYAMKKDIAILADILGHGSIETTRIYTISTGREHARQIQRLGLIM